MKSSIKNLKSCCILKVLYKYPMMIQCESKCSCISDILFEIELCLMNFSCILHVRGLTGFLDCYCHLLFKQNMAFRREADFLFSEGEKWGCSSYTNSVVSDNMRLNDAGGCKEYLALVVYE